MYNLNVNVTSSASGTGNLLGVETPCTTPKTPEILNSLIAMTNPFDGYSTQGPRLRIASCPPDASSSSSSASSCSPDSPPSVQHTCSQLIKEGLKLTIQTKRRNTGRHLETLDSPRNKMSRREEVSPDDDLFSPGARLTAEDEERRRRRRERNKIAATKCRLKKRERTVNLVQESEVLENQNHDLKSQIQELETQRRRLMDMLSMHSPTCMKNNANNSNTGSSPTNNPHMPYSPESHQAAPSVAYDTSQMVASGPTATFCGVLDASNGVPTSGYHHFNAFAGGYSTTSGVDSGCMA